jgi:hypothetical protein
MRKLKRKKKKKIYPTNARKITTKNLSESPNNIQVNEQLNTV